MMALENCAEEFDLVWRRELLHPERKSHGDLMKDFECCCCQEVMIDPTTLNCGHSLCRHCLASWFLKSKKRECPQCKQTWTGHPKVNLILRNTIELLCKETVSRRRSDLEEEGEYRNTVKEFDQRLGDGGSRGGEEHNRGFCSGLLFSLFGLLVLYVLWYWGHGDYNLLVHKPLQHWRVSDVETWLSELGEWAKPYAQHARNTNIDGTLLMNIDEENIVSVLNVTSPLHLKAVLSSLNLAKDLGVKPPQNLWDFKELYRGQSLFLLYGMKDFPRLTMLYSYFFAYDEVVVPFVQFTVRDQSVALEDYHRSKLPPPTSSQWREFLVKMLLFPYFLIVVFASHWLEAHYWTSRFIICNSVALTVLEVIAVWRFVRGNWRSPHSRVMAYLRSWLSMGIFAAAWPLIPVIFTDCMFYVALFYSPFLSIERLYKEFR